MTDKATPSSELLVSFLAHSDARCPSCRYALRGCTSDKCPECGRELTLQIVASQGVRSAWWIAAVYGVSIASILSLIMLALLLRRVVAVLEDPNIPAMVRAGYASQGDLPQWPSIFTVFALNAIAGIILALLIRRREAFVRLSAYQQAALGMLCLLTPAIMLGILNLLTR